MTLNATTMSVMLNNLTTGATYNVRVVAYTRVGAGPYSQPVSDLFKYHLWERDTPSLTLIVFNFAEVTCDGPSTLNFTTPCSPKRILERYWRLIVLDDPSEIERCARDVVHGTCDYNAFGNFDFRSSRHAFFQASSSTHKGAGPLKR